MERPNPTTERGIALDSCDQPAVRLLEYLQQHGRPISIEKLAYRTETERAVARRHLETLVERDAVGIATGIRHVFVRMTDEAARTDGGVPTAADSRPAHPPTTALPLGALLDVLSTSRRREALRLLTELDVNDAGDYLTVSELALGVAAGELNPASPAEVEGVDGVYTTLKDNHIPRLAAHDIVDYRPHGRGSTVAPTERLLDVVTILEYIEELTGPSRETEAGE